MFYKKVQPEDESLEEDIHEGYRLFIIIGTHTLYVTKLERSGVLQNP